MTDAICTGCGCHAKDTGEYSKHNPVTGDGTYADGQFVCTGCYMILVDKGCDVGEPIQLQRLAARIIGSIREKMGPIPKLTKEHSDFLYSQVRQALDGKHRFWEDFKAERDAVLRSMDEQTIRAFAKKNQSWMPDDPTAFWGAVHKARTALTTMTKEEKDVSRQWLKDHGMSPMPGADE